MTKDELDRMMRFPRNVCIVPTISTVCNHDEDLDPDSDAVLLQQGYGMQFIDIESWDEVPDGFQLHNENDLEAHEFYYDNLDEKDLDLGQGFYENC
jgi:hypothetical protein